LIHFDSNGGHSSLPLHFFLERYETAYRVCLQTFIDCVLKDTPSPVDAHDGLMATAIGIAAMKSLTEGRSVKLDEILQYATV
jgi:myo-inositol 2-dehydrogenase/D-chiro-inositol 1-dehydrogenase